MLILFLPTHTASSTKHNAAAATTAATFPAALAEPARQRPGSSDRSLPRRHAAVCGLSEQPKTRATIPSTRSPSYFWPATAAAAS